MSEKSNTINTNEVNYDNFSQTHKKFGLKPKSKWHKTPASKSKITPKGFTFGRATDPKYDRDLMNEASPFSYPKDYEQFAHKVMTKAWRNDVRLQELKNKYNEKNNYQTRLKLDLINRLHIDEPKLSNLRTMNDVDPEFYTLVEGRHISDKVTIRDYIHTVREVLRTRIVTGYREDHIMLMEQNLRLEQKMINKIRNDYQTYANTFEEFLYNDHTYSMRILKQSEVEAKLANEKYDEYKELSKDFGALRSILYAMEEKWRNYKMYQTFLYLVSPLSWRKKHDPYYLKHDDIVAVQGVGSVFGKYRITFTGDAPLSLEDLIDQFLREYEFNEVPQLYFKEPKELIDVFRFMELQNLNSLLHSEELAIPLINVREGMARAEQLFNEEINGLKETIEKLEGGILWEEERARNLEELAMKLINGKFRKLIIDDDVLNLQVFVEDLYETRIGPNDANLNVNEMMKVVEAKYLQELIKLDLMPPDMVTKIESNYYAEENRTIKAAKVAARKLLELERLFEALKKAFSPPTYKTTRELKWRSRPRNPPKPPPPEATTFTGQDVEFLEYFTDYCDKVDDFKKYKDKVPKKKDKEESKDKEENKDDIASTTTEKDEQKQKDKDKNPTNK